MEIVQVEVGLLQNFSTLIAAGRECAIVDPAFEVDRLLTVVRERGWTVRSVLVTHSHHDHIDGVAELCAATSALVYVGAGELERLRAAAPAAMVQPIADGEAIPLGEHRIVALATPATPSTADPTSPEMPS